MSLQATVQTETFSLMNGQVLRQPLVQLVHPQNLYLLEKMVVML
jgi:hypothetical protein